MNKKLIWLVGILIVILAGLSIWSWLNRQSSINMESRVEEIINQELSGDVVDKSADLAVDNQLLGSWQIVSLADGQQEVLDFSSDDLPVEFNEGTLDGKICNIFGGNYKLVDEANFVADGPINHTEMACNDELMKLEDVFIRGLERGWGYGISDNNILALVSSDGWIIGLIRK